MKINCASNLSHKRNKIQKELNERVNQIKSKILCKKKKTRVELINKCKSQFSGKK